MKVLSTIVKYPHFRQWHLFVKYQSIFGKLFLAKWLIINGQTKLRSQILENKCEELLLIGIYDN